MTAPQKRAPVKSDAAVQIEALLGRVGEGASVDSWTNNNGWVTCATVPRPNSTKMIRHYSEGASSQASSELCCLAAVRQAVGA